MEDPGIHVERTGAGPRVVCVHGSMSHGSEVFESLRELTDLDAAAGPGPGSGQTVIRGSLWPVRMALRGPTVT